VDGRSYHAFLKETGRLERVEIGSRKDGSLIILWAYKGSLPTNLPTYRHDNSYRLRPFSKWQPEVMLHGIKLTADGDPIIPCLGRLTELSAANKWCSEFDWDESTGKWTAIHSQMNQG